MSARVLVVDDVDVNIKILEAKLRASYFEVSTATSGAEALEKAEKERPDLILLDVMMPEMNGFECCRRLKANPALSHIPVVMVTALDQTSDRVTGLEAGADDFLTKPPNDMALFARVRSLVRLKMSIDELRARDETIRGFADSDALHMYAPSIAPEGDVVIVESRPARAEAMRRVLMSRLPVSVTTVDNRADAIAAGMSAPKDLFIVANRLDSYDGLRLCSELRAQPETRRSSLICTVDDGAFDTIALALDLGANDYIMRPVDENELVARTRAQLMRKNYADRLRADVDDSLRLAVTDSLTGLYNRRYADQHLGQLTRRRKPDGAPSPVTAILVDLDHFKSVNDTYGHPAGDAVLVELADRMRNVLRSFDLCARFGGEEFLVIMPETDEREGRRAAERIREEIAKAPFEIPSLGAAGLPVTASLGVADSLGGQGCDAVTLIERADRALYASKHRGRDRVTTAGDLDDAAVA